MVSSFSNPGFPPVDAHPNRLPAMDARLSAAIDSFEASMRAALRDAIREALDSAFVNFTTNFSRDWALLRSDSALRAEGVSDPVPTTSDDTQSIALGHPGLQGDDTPPRLPSLIEVHSVPPLFSSSPLLREIAAPSVKPQLNSNDTLASTIHTSVQGFVSPLRNTGITKIAVPFLLADQNVSDSISLEEYGDYWSFNAQTICLYMLPLTHTNTTKRRHEVLTSLLSNFTNRKDKWYWVLQLILAYYTGVIVIIFEDFLTDKCGWGNWYLVGKFVMKNFYALHLFDEMFERHNMENMSFCSNLEALDIVVLVYRSWPKDLVASFTKENGTLGHIHAIKQFLCLSLLHICALTVMAISQLHYSISTSLLLKLNKEFCNRVDVHLDAVSFPNCVENDQIFQQPGWCHKLNDPCDNISYQRVFFNKRNNTKWLMEKPCILSFTVVEEKGKRKAFGFVTSIIRLLEESANLKGLKGGHVGQEQDMFAILSCKHINDLLKIKAELFPCNFQKLLPIVLCLPLVIEHDNAWKIAILFCDAALDTIVLQFLLELLSVGKASVGIVIREGTTNENVFDIGTWAILFEDHCFMVEEMLYLAEMDQHFPDDTYLSDALPLNPRKSLIAHTSYFKKVIFMVTNNLTSSPNLEIEVKLLFQENGTTSSILLFLFHGMHSKECGKSGKKEALQFVAETAQQCGTVNAVRQYLWLFEEFPPKVVHAYVDSFNFRGRGFDEAWFHRFAGKFKEKYKIDVFQNATACLHLCTACEMLKKVLSANHEAPLNTECLMEEKVFSRMKLTSILGLFHDNSLYYEMTDESLMSYKGKSNENEYLINHIDSSKHIDFLSGGVTSALRITDGALAVVDGIEEASTCRSANLQSSIATIETIMNNLYDDLTAVIQVDPLPCDISRSEYQWHVPSHQNAWKQITKEGSYNGQFQGQFHFVFIVASRTSIFNTKAEIALKENFATAATLLVAARFKQVSTVVFLSLEDKANFQGGNIVMNPICD